MSSLLYRINFLCTSVRVLCNLYHPRSRINSIRRDKTLVVVHLWRRIRSWEHQKIYISLVVLPARDKGQTGRHGRIHYRAYSHTNFNISAHGSMAMESLGIQFRP